MSRNRFIGITGGIGSGKTTVSRFWSAYSKLPLVDIDQLCRELLEVEMPGWFALKESLGNSFFGSDGQLDRPLLRSAIFDDDDLRCRVNQLIHPLALDLLNKKTADMGKLVLVDVPLLFEAGWQGQFQHTVMVYADQHSCCRRVTARDNVLPEEASKAIVSQMGSWTKAMLADHVIDNRYGWLCTRVQVAHLARIYESTVRS